MDSLKTKYANMINLYNAEKQINDNHEEINILLQTKLAKVTLEFGRNHVEHKRREKHWSDAVQTRTNAIEDMNLTIKKLNAKIALLESKNIDILFNTYNAAVGGETTLYYLKLNNGNYKIGVTIKSVSERYKGSNNFTILFEKKITHARTIEAKIKRDFKHLLVSEYDNETKTVGSEIFSTDILGLDK